MGNEEENRANTVGVIPNAEMESLRVYPRMPDAATQVRASTAVVNTTTTLYTVTAGKTLYLCHAWLGVSGTGASGSYGYLAIYTSGAAVWYRLGNFNILQNTGQNISHTFNPALEVPASYYFYMSSSAANINCMASIFGYEI